MRRVEEYWFKFEYPAALSQETDAAEETPERCRKQWKIVYDAVATLESAVIILMLFADVQTRCGYRQLNAPEFQRRRQGRVRT